MRRRLEAFQSVSKSWVFTFCLCSRSLSCHEVLSRTEQCVMTPENASSWNLHFRNLRQAVRLNFSTVATVLLAMGGYGAYLGWRVRNGGA